jgi:hypothetical protein
MDKYQLLQRIASLLGFRIRTWTKFLSLEQGGFLLQEDGGKFIVLGPFKLVEEMSSVYPAAVHS